MCIILDLDEYSSKNYLNRLKKPSLKYCNLYVKII